MKNVPEGDQGQNLRKKGLRGTTSSFFIKMFFFLKCVYYDVVFCADSEYDIYFVWKWKLDGDILRKWSKLTLKY